MEVRYRYQDALEAAFNASYLDFLGWSTESFMRQVIIPALFPEYFPPIERSNVIKLVDPEHIDIEPIDNYRPELDYAFAHLDSESGVNTRTVYEVRTFLGWVAMRPDAHIIDFPKERVQPPSEFPADHNALLIRPFDN